jgi:hypothetical protein
MAGLLVSKEPARGRLAFKDWLNNNKDIVGTKYASELARHFQ